MGTSVSVGDGVGVAVSVWVGVLDGIDVAVGEATSGRTVSVVAGPLVAGGGVLWDTDVGIGAKSQEAASNASATSSAQAAIVVAASGRFALDAFRGLAKWAITHSLLVMSLILL